MPPVRPIPDRYLSPSPPGEAGLLFSFYFMQGRSLVDYTRDLPPISTFVDSGGFSAFTQGVDISVKDYASWLRRNLPAVGHYANLDVVGDPRGTLQNQIKLERLGLRPLPIVHYGTTVDEVRRYAGRGYDYICLGGLVPHLGRISQAHRAGNDHEGLRWLRDCHRVAQELGVGLHGFGVTRWALLRAFPWRSVDSSSWSTSVRYGRLPIFDPSAGRWQTTAIRDVPQVMRLSPLIRSYGVEPLEILRDAEHTRRCTVIVAVRSWVAAMRWMRERGQDTQVYVVSPCGTFGTTDPEIRNAVRVAAGMEHANGLPTSPRP